MTAILIIIIGKPVLSKPTDNPDIIFVAWPVLLDATIDLTG